MAAKNISRLEGGAQGKGLSSILKTKAPLRHYYGSIKALLGRGGGPQYGQTPRPNEPPSESKSGDVVAQANGQANAAVRRVSESAARGFWTGRMDKSFDFSRGESESARNIDIRDSRMRNLLASGRGLPQSKCLPSFPPLISWPFLPSVADWCFLGDYTRLQHMYSVVIHTMHEQVKSRTRKRRTRQQEPMCRLKKELILRIRIT
jgi:hypothetical protein